MRSPIEPVFGRPDRGLGRSLADVRALERVAFVMVRGRGRNERDERFEYRVTLRAWIGARLERHPKAFHSRGNLDIFIVRASRRARLHRADRPDHADTSFEAALSHRGPRIPHQPQLQSQSRRGRGRAEAKLTDLMGIDPAQGETSRAALRGGPAVQAAFRLLPRGRTLLEDMIKSAPRTWTAMAFLNESRPARNLLRAGRRQGHAAPRQSAHLEHMDAWGQPIPIDHQGLPSPPAPNNLTKWIANAPGAGPRSRPISLPPLADMVVAS